MDFDFDSLENATPGERLPDAPMTDQQRSYIQSLLLTCAYADDVKDTIESVLYSKITIDEAAGIIYELKMAQIDDLSLARSGRLRQKDLNKALARIVKMTNT